MDKVLEKLVAVVTYLDDHVTEGARPSKPVAEFLEAVRAEMGRGYPEAPPAATGPRQPEAPPAE